MKGMFLHIACLALLCTLLPACSQTNDEPAQDASPRTVMLNFSVSARSVSADNPGMPETLELWVYGGDEPSTSPLFYRNYGQLPWNKIENPGEGKTEYTYFFPEKVEVDQDYTGLRVYAVLNSASVTWSSGEEPTSTSTESELKDATFTSIAQTDTSGALTNDGSLLMYGMNTVAPEVQGDTLEIGKYYGVSIDCERCVSKLELYMTQRIDLGLKLKDVTLSKIPAIGNLLPDTLPANPGMITEPSSVKLLTAEKAIETILTGAEEIDPNEFYKKYDAADTTFTPIPLAAPFLKERVGVDWNATTSVFDDKTKAEEKDAYILSLTYTKSNHPDDPITKHLVLDKVERNTRYRIFIRVKEDIQLEVNTKTMPWRERRGDLVVDITPTTTN